MKPTCHYCGGGIVEVKTSICITESNKTLHFHGLRCQDYYKRDQYLISRAALHPKKQDEYKTMPSGRSHLGIIE